MEQSVEESNTDSPMFDDKGRLWYKECRLKIKDASGKQ